MSFENSDGTKYGERFYTYEEFHAESLRSYHLGLVHGREDALMDNRPVMRYNGIASAFYFVLALLIFTGSSMWLYWELTR